MIPDLFVVLSLAVAVAFLSVAARRLRAAPSILVLLAGVALAFEIPADIHAERSVAATKPAKASVVRYIG